MAREDYETVTLVWDDRAMSVSYQANWLNSGQWHLELRCDDILPVTETGYRSAFVPAEIIEDASAIEGYVLSWLDEAADDPAWHRRVEEGRQLKLF
jgi:hypothetical protein